MRPCRTEKRPFGRMNPEKVQELVYALLSVEDALEGVATSRVVLGRNAQTELEVVVVAHVERLGQIDVRLSVTLDPAGLVSACHNQEETIYDIVLLQQQSTHQLEVLERLAIERRRSITRRDDEQHSVQARLEQPEHDVDVVLELAEVVDGRRLEAGHVDHGGVVVHRYAERFGHV